MPSWGVQRRLYNNDDVTRDGDVTRDHALVFNRRINTHLATIQRTTEVLV